MDENILSLISVIVPIYKVEDYLDECVKSIVDQTYRNLEIILVDDGSPDKCPQMCEEWAKKDDRIRVIHKPNGGLSSARNAGLDVAKGDYICFVDSDDFISLDYVEVMYKRIVNDDTVGIVSGMIYRYTDGQITDYNSRWNIQGENIICPEDFNINCVNLSISFTVWNKIYRSDLISDVRFREGRTNEDTLFLYDLGKKIRKSKFRMVEIPHYVYYYRFRENSICTSAKKPLALDVIQNQKDMMRDCQQTDQRLWDAIFLRYSQTVYHFLDGLLTNDVWRPLYFKLYQCELRKISLRYIASHFSMKDIVYIELIKWVPSLRMIIRKVRNK